MKRMNIDHLIPLKRGDIVRVDLGGAIGCEKQNDTIAKSRPCIVVQNDGGNGGSPLTIVAPLTGAEHQGKKYKQQVLVTAKEVAVIGKTAKDSIVDCGHLRTIDREMRIMHNYGPIDPTVLPKIDEAIKASLGLA